MVAKLLIAWSLTLYNHDVSRYWMQTLAALQSFHRALKRSMERVPWTNHKSAHRTETPMDKTPRDPTER